MAISIKGIRVESLSLKLSEGDAKIEGEYSLISSVDKVLAKQSIGGYQGMAVQPSASTAGLLNNFLKAYKKDLETVLGLESE